MSEYADEEYEDHQEEYSGGLSEDEILAIQADYRRQKLKENIIGPCISTLVHITLLVLCAVFFQGEVVEKNETVEITPVQEEIPQEEPPPPPPPLNGLARTTSLTANRAKFGNELSKFKGFKFGKKSTAVNAQ